MSKLLFLVATVLASFAIMAQDDFAFLDATDSNSFSFFSKDKTDEVDLSTFQLVGGLVFVDAFMDGKKAKFILDTGSPGLIINQKPQDYSEQFIASGLTGNTSIGETTISEFKILNITKSNYQAYQMDLGHIENEILHKFNGLVGQDVFNNSILVLDYPNKKWGVSSELSLDESWYSISFELVEHFVVIEVIIDDKINRIVIDTGAEINLLDKKTYHSLNRNAILSSSELSIQGASLENVGSPCAVLDKIGIGTKSFSDQTFSIIDFSYINEGIENPFDGLLGYPFFEDKKVAIDFKRQLLHIRNK